MPRATPFRLARLVCLAVPFLLIFLVGCASTSTAPPEPPAVADLVITNANVFTGDPARPHAQAVAIRDAKIVAVGDDAAVDPFVVASTEVLDAGGRLMIPGLNDAHVHFGARPGGFRLELPSPEPTLDEVVAALRRVVATVPPGGWIYGEIGERVLGDPEATRDLFDSIVGDRPLFLEAYTGHGILLDSASLRALGIAEDETDPMGGTYDRDANGRLTGKLEEYACYVANQRLTALATDAERRDALADLANRAVRYGLTTLQVMPWLPLDEFVSLDTRAAVPLRTRVMQLATTTPQRWNTVDYARRPASLPPLLTVSGTKWILDGTPVERGAAMRRPYADEPSTTGRLNFAPETLREMLREIGARRDQPLVHAVGDRAIDTYLDALEATGGPELWRPLRPRIEHGDFLIHPEQLDAVRALGAIVVQNPSHFMGDFLAPRYGAELAHAAQPMRTLLRDEIPLALGSDGPLNPFLNIMFATMHPANPEEALTREEAVVAYTRGSARAELRENELGTIAPGMLADLAVLSQDIFAVPPQRLPATESVLTIVDGRIVWEAAGTVTRRQR